MALKETLQDFYQRIRLLKAKKIITYISLGLLTIAASSTLAFLVLGGMYALLPVAAVAILVLTLAIAYEAVIYWENIKAAFNKVSKMFYLKNRLAKEYLFKHLMDHLNSDSCPKFYKDYQQQIVSLEKYDDIALDANSKKGKKAVEKKLSDMEKWFAKQLFANESEEAEQNITVSDYARAVRNNDRRAYWKELLKKRQAQFIIAKLFSILSGSFMGLGMTYLIAETLSILGLSAMAPWVWPVFPFIILASGMRDFNSITNFFLNDTFNKWKENIQKRWRTNGAVKYLVSTVFLLVLSLGMTACAGGTWWTVAFQNVPLYGWVMALPPAIIGIVNPIITGISSAFFNIQNSFETIELLSKVEHPIETIRERRREAQALLEAKENEEQRKNPFRKAIKYLFLPFLLLLFLGHLLSMSFTSDRVPGIPILCAAFVAFVLEFLTDVHYFLDLAKLHHHKHPAGDQTQHLLQERLNGHGHSHDNDLPALLLKGIFLPFFAFAALWDSVASKSNVGSDKEVLNFTQALRKQMGLRSERVDYVEANLSQDWRREHAAFLIEKYSKKHFSGCAGSYRSAQKEDDLNTLRSKIQTEEKWEDQVRKASSNQAFNDNRFFVKKSTTTTKAFLEKLPERVLGTIAGG